MNTNTTHTQARREDNLSSDDFDSIKQSIILRFEQMVDRYPENIAVKDQDQTLSYRALNAKANRLARIVLENSDTNDDAPVALLADTNVNSIVSMLGILKAGRPYVALHPSSPVERLKAVLSSAGSTTLVSTRQYQGVVEEISANGPAVLYLEDMDLTGEAANPGIYVSPVAPFSIIYTSGSTGEPKGIVHNHGLLIFWILPILRQWQHSPNDRSSLFTSLSFGASGAVILNALLSGGMLCLFDIKKHATEKVLDWIRSERISILRLTPSVLRTIFELAPKGMIFPDIRLVGVAGEAVKRNDVALFQAHTGEDSKLVNLYAQAEVGYLATYTIGHQTPLPDGDLPAGHPFPGYEITLRDDAGAIVRTGEAGEIVVKSRHLSMGYWRQPELTAEKFFSVPGEPGVKIFHTGDLGRWRADGTLEHLGRVDTQIKIRGQRVEISEVESTLRQNPAVKDAILVARPSKHQPDQLQLIAYVVLQPGSSATVSDLRASLSAKLLDYSIPAFFVFLDQLPLNANGKVDRQALPDLPEREALSTSDLPADEIEEQLVEIWRTSLKMKSIGVNDNFFELGGDSLLVLSMTLEVEKALSYKVPASFFKHPTIRNLAQSLRENDREESGASRALVAESYRKKGWRAWLLTLKKRIKRERREFDAVFHIEGILFQFVQGQSFRKVTELVYWLADQPYLLKTIYAGKYRMFRELLESLGVASQNPMQLFRQNFINYTLSRLLDAKPPFSMPKYQRAGPGSFYFRDRQRFIESTPIDQLDEFFPVVGFNYLEHAYRQKRGVILLSFHSTPANRVAHQNLARRLGSPKFQAVAHDVELERKWRSGGPTTKAAVFAEVALRGQNLLLQGNVVTITAELAIPPGRMYPIQVGDRIYPIKAGFAQLALNTGAIVIPVYGRYVEHGRLLVSLLQPLDPGTGSREEQIQVLISQYGNFMNTALESHPEILAWRPIRTHLFMQMATPTSTATLQSSTR